MTKEQLEALIKLQREGSKAQQEILQLHQDALLSFHEELHSLRHQIIKLEERMK